MAASSTHIAVTTAILMLLVSSQGSYSIALTIVNECTHPVWCAVLSDAAGASRLATNSFDLQPREVHTVPLPPGWSGHVWGSATVECGGSYDYAISTSSSADRTIAFCAVCSPSSVQREDPKVTTDHSECQASINGILTAVVGAAVGSAVTAVCGCLGYLLRPFFKRR